VRPGHPAWDHREDPALTQHLTVRATSTAEWTGPGLSRSPWISSRRMVDDGRGIASAMIRPIRWWARFVLAGAWGWRRTGFCAKVRSGPPQSRRSRRAARCRLRLPARGVDRRQARRALFGPSRLATSRPFHRLDGLACTQLPVPATLLLDVRFLDMLIFILGGGTWWCLATGERCAPAVSV